MTTKTTHHFDIPRVKLSNGVEMPALGLGTSRTGNETYDLEKALKFAMCVGYRHIDGAWIYHNDAVIQKVLKECFSGTEQRIKRDELFMCCKLWNTFHTKNGVQVGLEETLKNYGVDYLDAYYIHWPMAFQENTRNEPYPKDSSGKIIYSDTSYLETYQALEDSFNNKLIRCIGLSNFNIKQCQDVLRHCKVKPVLNQIEVHPYFQNEKLVEFCQNNGITVVAYSPLGCVELAEVRSDVQNVLDDKTLKKIGKKYNKTAAQVCLRWSIQRGCVPIPNAVTEEDIIENASIFDFQLSDEDMQEIKKLDRGSRVFKFADCKDHPQYPFNED